MAKRTILNCGIIRNMKYLSQPSPKIIDGKREGYNTLYYSINGKHLTCDKCKLNVKHK